MQDAIGFPALPAARRRARLAFAAALSLAFLPGASLAAPAAPPHGWPREFTTERGSRVVIYQPQVQTFKGDAITGRAAVAVTRKGAAAPRFGVVFFSARVWADRDAGTVTVRDVKIGAVRFPNLSPEQEKAFAGLIEAEVPRWRLVVSYDRLLENLRVAEREKQSVEGLRNEPPKILFAEEPTVLVTFDGEPLFRKVQDSSLEVAVNTPFLVLRDPGSGQCYLAGGRKWWYQAADPKGPWRPIAGPPPEVAARAEKYHAAEAAREDGTELAAPPKIAVATEPTELVVSEGKPAFKPVAGLDLLFMDNTESDVFLDVPTQQYYVLLSGRWFRSPSLSGPWSFVPPETLPASFAQIPAGSPAGDALASVPGTDEADDAVLDSQMPQVAGIRRAEGKLTVEFDGEPQFVAIAGTDVEYASNASSVVLRIGGRYYACDDAVWYVAEEARGPWRVADTIPADEIDRIPPSSPVYNVRYVRIYDSTPDVVYVGYTPGYLGWYVWGDTVVWGTGWYYPPWVGAVWYWPWPWTWGLCAHYSPWWGWGFGISWSYPFQDMWFVWGGWYRPIGWPFFYDWGRHRVHRGWWGAGGYRPPEIVGVRGRLSPGGGVSPWRRPDLRPRVGFRPGRQAAPPPVAPRNIYDRLPPGRRITAPAPSPRISPRPLPRRPNNVYGGRDGNVYRRSGDGSWQRYDGSRFTPLPAPRGGTISRPAAPAPDLQRDFSARQRGEIRSRPPSAPRVSPARPSAPRPVSPPPRPHGRR